MIGRRRWAVALCGTACILTACTTPPAEQQGAAVDGSFGATGIGDDYYPDAGNGGYDVERYDVTVRYDPGRGHLDGDTTVTATATQDLARFNLDLRGFTVSSVEVDGAPAEFTRDGETELVITPAEAVAQGTALDVRVRYDGEPVRADAGQIGGNGWHRTFSGGAFVLGEPQSASYWFPVNEHPRDRAAFTLTATVPDGWEAVSIGEQGDTSREDGWTTTTWTEDDPIASYLTMFAVDRFTVERGELDDGTPVRNVFGPGTDEARAVAGRIDDVIGFLASRFGDYPAGTAGGVYLNHDLGYALETQGTPTYPTAVDVELIVHEVAHQWYGNAVAVHSWADVCLNECFAAYAAWLWAEHEDDVDLDARYRDEIARVHDATDFWERPLHDMGSGNEFDAVYDKGPLAFHALRRLVGEEAFDRLSRRWVARHSGGNATWEQFEEFAEEVTGRELSGFFDAWFSGTERPEQEYLRPGSLGE